MAIDPVKARMLAESAHAAWSSGSLESMLVWFTEDASYTSNIGPNFGEPYMIAGKDAIRGFLAPIMQIAESMSVIDHFVVDNGVSRARISCFIRDKATGLVLSGTYTQKHSYRDGLIASVEEIHDAAKMAAFWRLVGSHVSPQGSLATLE